MSSSLRSVTSTSVVRIKPATLAALSRAMRTIRDTAHPGRCWRSVHGRRCAWGAASGSAKKTIGNEEKGLTFDRETKNSHSRSVRGCLPGHFRSGSTRIAVRDGHLTQSETSLRMKAAGADKLSGVRILFVGDDLSGRWGRCQPIPERLMR